MSVRKRGDRLDAATNGRPTFLGKIIATTTKNNHDTAVPFNDAATGATSPTLAGKLLLIQTDAAGYIYPGTTNTATVTTANGVLLAAGERVVMNMGELDGWLAALAVSGTMNVRVWELS